MEQTWADFVSVGNTEKKSWSKNKSNLKEKTLKDPH